MNNIKKIAKALVLSGVIMMGVHTAQAGIIVNYSSSGSKTETCQTGAVDKGVKVDNGIIVNLTGIIVNFTGIIVNFADEVMGNKTDSAPVECGIIVN